MMTTPGSPGGTQGSLGEPRTHNQAQKVGKSGSGIPPISHTCSANRLQKQSGSLFWGPRPLTFYSSGAPTPPLWPSCPGWGGLTFRANTKSLIFKKRLEKERRKEEESSLQIRLKRLRRIKNLLPLPWYYHGHGSSVILLLSPWQYCGSTSR